MVLLRDKEGTRILGLNRDREESAGKGRDTKDHWKKKRGNVLL